MCATSTRRQGSSSSSGTKHKFRSAVSLIARAPGWAGADGHNLPRLFDGCDRHGRLCRAAAPRHRRGVATETFLSLVLCGGFNCYGKEGPHLRPGLEVPPIPECDAVRIDLVASGESIVVDISGQGRWHWSTHLSQEVVRWRNLPSEWWIHHDPSLGSYDSDAQLPVMGVYVAPPSHAQMNTMQLAAVCDDCSTTMFHVCDRVCDRCGEQAEVCERCWLPLGPELRLALLRYGASGATHAESVSSRRAGSAWICSECLLALHRGGVAPGFRALTEWAARRGTLRAWWAGCDVEEQARCWACARRRTGARDPCPADHHRRIARHGAARYLSLARTFDEDDLSTGSDCSVGSGLRDG